MTGNPQKQPLQATSSAVGIAPGFVDRTAPQDDRKIPWWFVAPLPR